MTKKLLVSLCFFMSLAQADQAMLETPEAQSFIDHMNKDYGFDKAELERLLVAVTPRPSVIKKIKHPTEENPWHTYERLFITQTRITAGATYWKNHQEALERAEQVYHVPVQIEVATIGVETNYGKTKGNYRVIDALANIAFNYSSRSKFFRYELEQFLLFTRDYGVDPLSIKGSYAGAMGQPQFMPDSYRKYAVDFSNTGNIDLTNDDTDVIGSIANYYQQHGWHEGEPVVLPAIINGEGYKDLVANSHKHLYTEQELQDHGVTTQEPLPKDGQFLFIALQTKDGMKYWVGLHNFMVILRYNSSPLYAMAVVELGEAVVGKINTPSP